jgi:stage II sporulation protein D
MFREIAASVILLCVLAQAQAQRVNIRLLSNTKISSIIISPLSPDYAVYFDGQAIPGLESHDVFQFTVAGDSIAVKALERNLGKFRTIRFVGRNNTCHYKFKGLVPETRIRVFPDNLDISVSSGSLRLINGVDIEDYVAGVVEAESGTRTTVEYYKLQSILCRTYALSNMRRHEMEGYNLCDQVHCQAYKGRTIDEDIKGAVEDTKGLVVVDSNLDLITAAFHSNCGGQTINSEDVWASPLPYLKAVKDTFCLKMPHARWERKIATEDWVSYLSMKHKFPVGDSSSFISAVNFPQHARSIYFTDKGSRIPLKTIRSDWQLKSTYFSIEQRTDSVIFKGKGYGHGVGLCQEGAMRRSQLGYTYKEILSFYYRDVVLVDLTTLEFFRKE